MKDGAQASVDDDRDQVAEGPDVTCADLIGPVIEMTEREAPDHPFVEMYDYSEVQRGSNRIDCHGGALLSTGYRMRVDFHARTSSDGRLLYGYKVGAVDVANTKCEEMVGDIKKLSARKAAAQPESLEVLTIYDLEEVARTPRGLDCRGIARWSDGRASIIDFHIELDPAGSETILYGYESGEQVNPRGLRQETARPGRGSAVTAVGSVTLGDLRDAHTENGFAAAEMYLDKRVEVSGYVAEVSTTGKVTLLSVHPDARFPTGTLAAALLTFENRNRVMRLSRGEQITVVCRLDSFKFEMSACQSPE